MSEKKSSASHEDVWARLHAQLDALEVMLSRDGAVDANALRARLDERARTFAAAPTGQADLERIDVLRFQVGSETYAVTAETVAQVVSLKACVALPYLPAHIQGIVSVQGRVVSVLDLRVLFGLPIGTLPERNFLIVLRDEQMEFGLLAHQIFGIEPVACAELIDDLPN